jgi:long-chain fatty acid transport protein
VTAGFYWQATSQLALLSDISWTDWSLLKAISVTPASPFAAPSSIMENLRNIVAISVGANYRLTLSVVTLTSVQPPRGFGRD